MILGRPTNLWMGLVTSLVGLLSLVAIASGADPELVAQFGAAGALVLGSLITLIANGTPTVKEGSTVNVVTPEGQDNYSTKV